VLLVACANVANLLLSRSVARHKEIALRSALGATRRRIVRQLLTESMLLAFTGAAVALIFAAVTIDWIRALGEGSVPRVSEIQLDVTVLLFTLAIATVAGLLFGAAPAWRLARLDVNIYLKDGGRGTAAADSVWAGRSNLRQLLVVGELALSLVLLIGAGLLIRSFDRVQRVLPGFNASNVLTLELTMTGRKYADQNGVLNAYRDIWSRLENIPGVVAAGGVSSLPLSQMFAWGPITVDGRVPRSGEEFINVDIRMVGGRYFQAMEIPLKAGRWFDVHDTRETTRVAIIDERMAEELWPNDSPIGKRVRTGGLSSTSPWITVVGVVGTVKQYALDSDSRMALYLAHGQYSTRAMNVVVKSEQSPAALASAVRETLKTLDPDLPMYNVLTMTDRVSDSLAQRRFAMLLLALFAAIGLILATIGIYGVMSYLVSQGRRELGIRLALGATPGRVLWLVGRHTAVIALTGVTIGLALAFGLTRFMQSLLYEVSALDGVTFVSIGVFLLLTALIAGLVPARRAARIDPVLTLRAEN
jgi:predicted permease